MLRPRDTAHREAARRGLPPVVGTDVLRRGALVFLFVAALLSGLPGQGFWGLHGEGRRAEVGREVYADGQWLVPTLLGKPFITKPPLLYWAIGGTFRLTGGVSEFRARLPGLAATVGTLLLVMALGRLGALPRPGQPSPPAGAPGLSPAGRAERCGLAAGLAFASSPLVLGMGRMAETEPLLLFFSTLSVYAYARIPPGASALEATRWRLLLAAALTAGFLVKGPLGWIFPLLGVGAMEALSAAGQRRLRWTDALFLAGATAALALPWFVAVARRVPHAVGTWLGESVSRLDPDFPTHREPAWYYLPGLASFGPWALLLPAALRGLPHAWKDREAQTAGPVLWLLAGVVFLSLAASKRTHYLLSLAPAYALAVAPLLVDGLSSSTARRALVAVLGRALWIFPAGLLGAALFLGAVRRVIGPGEAAVLVLGAGAIGAFLWGSRRGWLPWTLATTLCASAAVAGLGLLPAVDAYRSPRAFFQEARGLVGPAEPVWNWQTDRFSSSFYLGRHVAPLRTVEELAAAAPRGAWLFTSSHGEPPVPPGAEIALARIARDPFFPRRQQGWYLLRWSPTLGGDGQGAPSGEAVQAGGG